MRDGTAKLLLGFAAGGAAVWGYSRWHTKKTGRRDRPDEWGAEHDEVAVEPRYEPAVEAAGTRTKALSRAYDLIFTVHGMGLPVPYLRALAARESGLNPLDPKGLINVVSVVLEDFNTRHGTDIAPALLKNPVTNVMIASDALRRIVDSYAHHHPEVENLREDWNNRHFVELLTLGWVGGWSERKGLGRVVSYLERQGQTDITLGDITRAAYPAGAKHWLWDPAKIAWTRSVADLYVAELGRDLAAGRVVPPVSPTGTSRTVGAMSPGTATPEMLRFGRPAPDDVRLVVSSGWSRPRDGGRSHHAIDIPLPVGTPILAIDDGIVVRAQTSDQGAAGKWVGVKHPSGITSRSMHLSRVDVRVGQQIRCGERLGLSGNTGNSAGPHLHLDLRAPFELLVLIESWVGRPAGGWGSEMKPYGYSIPGESWIPVDDHAQVVKDEAATAGIRLHGAPTSSEPPLVASAAPVATPGEVDAPGGG
jgi:murein DD-endopeptidase MepM/ murein hydrolase activator NlpD